MEGIGKKVLVVEDDVFISDFILELLDKIRCDYSCVFSYDLALRVVARHKFDILFTDLGLPLKWDDPKSVDPFAGFELAERIMEKCPGIKVVFCTGQNLKDIQEKIPPSLAGALFLEKPFRAEDFYKIFEELS